MSSRSISRVALTLVLVLSFLLAGCGQTPEPTKEPTKQPPAPTAPPPTQPPTQPTQPPAPTATEPPAVWTIRPPEVAKIDWRQQAGKTINVLLTPHPYTNSLTEMLPKFEALTGIKVNIISEPFSAAQTKMTNDMGTGAGEFDVFFSGYTWDWDYWAHYVDLETFINDPKLTDKEWFNLDDFYPLILQSVRWDGVVGHGVGKGPLTNLPVTMETFILHYRSDLFEKYGVKVPETWEEVYDAAKKLTVTENGQQIYGLAVRGNSGHSLFMVAWLNMYLGRGIDPVDEKFTSRINDPAMVPVIDGFVKTMAANGPPGWAALSWDGIIAGFSTGQFAMAIDSDKAAATYENPATSQVVGKVGYAPPPAGPEGRFSSSWYWGLAMNEYSKNKEAAWLFIQWASSAPTLLEGAAVYFSFDPPRMSVMQSKEVQALVSDWGKGSWYPTVQQALSEWTMLRFRPQPGIVNNWGKAVLTPVLEAYAGKMTTEQALNQAQTDSDKLYSDKGWKK